MSFVDRPWSLLLVLIGLGCAPASPTVAASAEPSEPEAEVVPAEVRGTLALARGGELEQLSFAPEEQLVSCRWFAEPEAGDYLWVRLASDPRDDGDAGPRLDIDLCRVSQRAEGRYAPMPAGAHGSHCGPEPGFAVWWHEGERAVNSGPEPADCELELDFDAEAKRVSGSFSCAGLVEVQHEGEADAPKPEAADDAAASVSLPQAVTGSFSCELRRVRLPK